MDYQERDRIKLALDIFTIATSETRWHYAIEKIAETIDEIVAAERLRAGNACSYVAAEWLDHQVSEFGNQDAASLCRKLRASAARSAMLCAGRVDPHTKRDRAEQIEAYERGADDSRRSRP